MYAIKAYGVADLQLHSFLVLAVEWSGQVYAQLLNILGKRLPYPLNKKERGSRGQYACDREEMILLPLSRIEPRSFGLLTRILVTILIPLSRLCIKEDGIQFGGHWLPLSSHLFSICQIYEDKKGKFRPRTGHEDTEGE
jgi:hypothetical protein